MQVFAAADGQVIELEASSSAGKELPSDKFSALHTDASAVRDASLIMGISDARMALVLAAAARSAGVRTTHASDGASTLQLAKSAPPALILLEDQQTGIDGLNWAS
jgi:hypothetical protein